jgi:dCTP deaminase
MSHNELISRVVRQKVLATRRVDGNGEMHFDEIDFNLVNSASIDIRLGRNVMVERAPRTGENSILDFRRRDKMVMKRVEIDEDKGYILYPGEFILAESHEIFFLPNTISCEYKLKSSMARIALEHLNAGWADAGWNGSVLTLEFKNMSRYHSIKLRPMDAIGQMVFFSHEAVPEDRSYAVRGRYNKDTTVSDIKE